MNGYKAAKTHFLQVLNFVVSSTNNFANVLNSSMELSLHRMKYKPNSCKPHFIPLVIHLKVKQSTCPYPHSQGFWKEGVGNQSQRVQLNCSILQEEKYLSPGDGSQNSNTPMIFIFRKCCFKRIFQQAAFNANLIHFHHLALLSFLADVVE